MSNVIKTKQFWLLVQSEYNGEHYICDTSPTFCKEWEASNRQVLKNIAAEFIEAEINNNTTRIGDFILFQNGCVWNESGFARVRIDFIQWCINKFE